MRKYFPDFLCSPQIIARYEFCEYLGQQRGKKAIDFNADITYVIGIKESWVLRDIFTLGVMYEECHSPQREQLEIIKKNV